MIRKSIALAAAAFIGMSAQAAQIYSNNFEANATGVTGAGSLESSQGFSAFGFGNVYFRNSTAGNPAPATVLGVSVPGAATVVTMSFDLAVLDSWDGDAGFNCCGPDLFNVEVDGNVVFSRAFNIFNGSPATGSNLVNLVYGQSLAANGAWNDQAYGISLSLGNWGAGAHTVRFFASGTGWQAGDDESWAIDNVSIIARTIDNGGTVPEPATLALGAVALGALGIGRRRRRG